MTEEPRESGPVAARPRRRLRIGVGGLMLAILLFGLWLGHRVNLAREQAPAVAAVKADRGFVLGSCNQFGGDPRAKQDAQELVGDRLEVE